MRDLPRAAAPETREAAAVLRNILSEAMDFENQIHSRMRAAASTNTAISSINATTAQKSQA